MKIYRLAVLLLAVLQIVVPLVPAVRDNAFTQPDRPGQPAIVPAGYAFAIWGLIEVLSLAWAAWALARPDPSADRLAAPLAVVFSGFTLWLLAVTFVDSNWLPLGIFMAMFAGLLVALRRAGRSGLDVALCSPARRALCQALLGIYTGWTSVAVWANLTTAAVGTGAPTTGTAAVVAQLAVLAGATATAATLVRWTRGQLPYTAAVDWAFAGVTVGAAGAGQPILSGAAAFALVLVSALTLWQRTSLRPRSIATP